MRPRKLTSTLRPTKCRQFQQAANGTIAIEFALITPVVFGLLLGVIEVSQAVSAQLTVQAAARAGTHFGLTKPPVQGNVQPVIDSVKATLPPDWTDPQNADKATIAAQIFCECEIAGPTQCGVPCGAGDRSQTFLRVDVSKRHIPLLQFRYFHSSLMLSDTSMVRLQ